MFYSLIIKSNTRFFLKMILYQKRLKSWNLAALALPANFLSLFAPCTRTMVLAPEKKFARAALPNSNFLSVFWYNCNQFENVIMFFKK